MSILHTIYRIDILSPSTSELQGIIQHLYSNQPIQFYSVLRQKLNELLTNIPGSPLPVISSGVSIKGNTIEAHMWASKQEGKIVTEEISSLSQSFSIEPKLEFPAIKCGNVQRYRVPFKLNFVLLNGFIAVEYPLQISS